MAEEQHDDLAQGLYAQTHDLDSVFGPWKHNKRVAEIKAEPNTNGIDAWVIVYPSHHGDYCLAAVQCRDVDGRPMTLLYNIEVDLADVESRVLLLTAVQGVKAVMASADEWGVLTANLRPLFAPVSKRYERLHPVAPDEDEQDLPIDDPEPLAERVVNNLLEGAP